MILNSIFSRFSRFQRPSLFRMTLFNMALLDELITGFVFVGLPLLRDQFGLSYEQIGLLLSVGDFSAMLIEPVMNLLSDRGSKRWWILAGLLGLVVSFALIGNVHNFIILLLAFALLYPADGAAVTLSQAVLIDGSPENVTRTMTRWTMMSSIGDLLAPLAVGAFVAIGLGWSALCWFAVILCLAAGLFFLPQRFPRRVSHVSPGDDDDTDAEPGILAGLGMALRDPLLLRWVALAILPTMLDEIFLGFVALYLHDVLHLDEVAISIIIIIHIIGDFLGLLIVDRLVGRVAPRRLLIWLAFLTLIGVIMLLSLHSIWFAILALFIIGLGVAGLYPIAQAEAYARQPGRSGTVRAITGLGAPFEIALPGIVGLISGQFGVLAGIGLLGSAPLLILLLVPWRTSVK